MNKLSPLKILSTLFCSVLLLSLAACSESAKSLITPGDGGNVITKGVGQGNGLDEWYSPKHNVAITYNSGLTVHDLGANGVRITDEALIEPNKEKSQLVLAPIAGVEAKPGKTPDIQNYLATQHPGKKFDVIEFANSVAWKLKEENPNEDTLYMISQAGNIFKVQINLVENSETAKLLSVIPETMKADILPPKIIDIYYENRANAGDDFIVYVKAKDERNQIATNTTPGYDTAFAAGNYSSFVYLNWQESKTFSLVNREVENMGDDWYKISIPISQHTQQGNFAIGSLFLADTAGNIAMYRAATNLDNSYRSTYFVEENWFHRVPQTAIRFYVTNDREPDLEAPRVLDFEIPRNFYVGKDNIVHIEATDNDSGLVGGKLTISTTTVRNSSRGKGSSGRTYSAILQKSDLGENLYIANFKFHPQQEARSGDFVTGISVTDNAGNVSSIRANFTVKKSWEINSGNFVNYTDMQQLSRVKHYDKPLYLLNIIEDRSEEIDRDPPVIEALELPNGTEIYAGKVFRMRIKAKDLGSGINLKTLSISSQIEKRMTYSLGKVGTLQPEGNDWYSILLLPRPDLHHNTIVSIGHIKIEDNIGNSFKIRAPHSMNDDRKFMGEAKTYLGNYGSVGEIETDILIPHFRVLRDDVPPGMEKKAFQPLPSGFERLENAQFVDITSVLPLATTGSANPLAIPINGNDLDGIYMGPCMGRDHQASRRRRLLKFAGAKLLLIRAHFNDPDCLPSKLENAKITVIEFAKPNLLWPEEQVFNFNAVRELIPEKTIFFSNNQVRSYNDDKRDEIAIGKRVEVVPGKIYTYSPDEDLDVLRELSEYATKHRTSFMPIALRRENSKKTIYFQSPKISLSRWYESFRSTSELRAIANQVFNFFVEYDYADPDVELREKYNIERFEEIDEATWQEHRMPDMDSVLTEVNPLILK